MSRPCILVNGGCSLSNTGDICKCAYTHIMTFTNAREIVALGWVLALCGAGLAGQVSSVSDWIVLGVIALAGLVVLYGLWRPPAQTISERIRNARR